MMMACFVYRRRSNETCLDAGGPGPAGSIRLPTTETISSVPRVRSSTSWSGARMAFYERFTTRVGACTSFYFLIRMGNLADGTCVLFNSYRHHAMEVASAPGDVPGSNPSSADMSTKCESTPSAKCFQCPYHGWTYDLEGSLIRATKIGTFILIITRAM